MRRRQKLLQDEKNLTNKRVKRTNCKKNSNSGTSATKNFPSAEEVCKIVDICARNRVAKLKFGPLLVVFDPPEWISHTPAPGPATPVQAPENVILEQQNEEKRSLEEEEINLREQQIAELLVSDPLKAEELMEQGDLVELDDDGNDGSGG